MVKISELTAYLNDLLNFPEFAGDVSNNGLQVEACSEVNKVLCGVDASLALFEAAVAAKADLVIVHHGISWGAEPRRFDGWVGRRLALLFQNQISLYAAHLPLDAHPVIGHNAQLAKMIGLNECAMFCCYDGVQIGVRGILSEPCSAAALCAIYEKNLACAGVVYGDGQRMVRRVGCISGGAGHAGLDAAIDSGLEVLITGEMTHELWHQAKENELAVIALGHYCSEKPGILMLSELLNEKFNLVTEFADIPTGL
ncbi:MAG: Nif3-like dinuclear metal center hexameric protein [Victivallaceae bacterium]|nr:Nif3-like dinuclear metal center hexameric protein [Victivallaceae bacterium]